MKVGDLVKIVEVDGRISVIGTIIAAWAGTGWWEILTSNGVFIHWPENQLEVISESR